MKTFAIALVLFGYCCVAEPVRAAQSNDCKLCRDDLRACVKAHSQGACKTNYNICMRHCQNK